MYCKLLKYTILKPSNMKGYLLKYGPRHPVLINPGGSLELSPGFNPLRSKGQDYGGQNFDIKLKRILSK